jgi:protein TonB
VLVVAAAGTFTFLKWQKPGAPSAPQHTQEAANVPAIQPSASTGSEAQPGVPNNASASQPTATIAANSPVPTIKASENDGKKNAKNNTDKSSSTSDKTPAEKQTAVTTFAASGPSRINAQRNSDQSQPEIAPSFATGGNTSGSISALARPAGTVVPSAAAIEQSQLEPLQLIKTVPLPYPAIAKARRISGPVVVEVKVGKDGSVSNPKFISGQPIFKDSAFEAVLQYKFRPAKLNGQPIEQTTQVRLNFSQQ